MDWYQGVGPIPGFGSLAVWDFRSCCDGAEGHLAAVTLCPGLQLQTLLLLLKSSIWASQLISPIDRQTNGRRFKCALFEPEAPAEVA